MRFADIIERGDVFSLKPVAPTDFTPGAWGPPPPALDPEALVPYCLDLDREETLYVSVEDRRAVVNAPFQHMHLRGAARALLAVPWRHGRLGTRPAPAARFVFSVGRCGSTLLVEALRAGGGFAVSEPDFYTQAVAALPQIPAGARQQALASALGALTDDVLAALGAPISAPAVIKLRAACCRAPALVLACQASPVTLFLLRRFEPWAASMIAVTSANPAQLPHRYATYLQALEWLAAHSACHIVRYEDLTADPHAVLAEAAAHLGMPFDPSRIGPALAADAQAGTQLARNSPSRRSDPAALEAAIAHWKESRPDAFLRRLGLADYA